MRRGVLFALRLAMAATLLAVVFRVALPAGGADAVTALRSAWVRPAPEAWACFALGCALFGASFAVGALRFRSLLDAAGLTARFGSILRAYLVGSFFNLVLPGLMMGDVYRWADARRDAGRGAAVLGIVVLERLLGFAALGTMALIATPLLPAPHSGGAQAVGPGARAAVLGVAAAIALLPLAPFVPAARRVLEGLAGTLASLSPRAGDAVQRAIVAVAEAGARPGVLARGFGLSLLNQGLPVAAVVALAAPLESDVAWTWFAVIVPFVTLASLLPISIGGTGVRELLFVALFGAVGMRSEVALALSLSTLAAALVWGGVGLVLFAIGRGAASTPAEGRTASGS